MKRKHLLFCFLITICFVAITKIPIKLLLESLNLSRYSDELNILIKVSIIVFASYELAIKHRIVKLGGFKYPVSQNYWMLILPLLYPGIWALTNISGDCIRNSPFLLSTLIILLLKGLSEEVVFRGVIQGYLLKHNSSKSYHFIAVITSALFAISHLGNLVNRELGSVLSQIVYAFFMGMLFSALLFRTKNAWLLGIIHGILNFLFSLCSNVFQPDSTIQDSSAVYDYLLNIGSLVIIFSPTLLIYWALMRNIMYKKG